jgi:hypothetical protein
LGEHVYSAGGENNVGLQLGSPGKKPGINPRRRRDRSPKKPGINIFGLKIIVKKGDPIPGSNGRCGMAFLLERGSPQREFSQNI